MEIKNLVKLIKSGHVRDLSVDSRSVKPGSIFVAVKGAKEDASKFVSQAVAAKAKYIVCDADADCRVAPAVSLVRVKDTRLAVARLATEFYRYPAKSMKVLGVTGTNGKTTVTYLLEAMIKKEGLRPGVIGTVNYRFAKTVIPADNTTPGPLKLQAILRRMADAGVDYAAMEVSSHALDQERVAGIPFHSAIFTNLTQDHLDYHLTMSRYFQAKAKLFKGLKGKAFAVLNYDDKYYRFLNSLLKVKSISYGLHPKAQVRAADIKYTVAGTQFTLIFPAGVVRIKTALIGRHNVYNILAAFSWGIKEGMSIKKMKSAIEDFKAVPGRLERIASRAGFSVFVDYAHTDDALKNALFSLRELSPRRIITVFGCGGERDRLKRPKMGRVVTQLSDFALITNDNPRCEDPAKIAKEIVSGIEKNNFRVCLDRGMAIRAALSMAGRGDIVLIAGKGHEAYQVLKKKAVHFDDREEARLCLKSLNY